MKKRKKLSIDLDKKLGKYALMTGAALVAFTGCGEDDPDNPNVTYNDITDVTLAAGTNQPVERSFDIDGDGVNDFTIRIGNYNGADGNYRYSDIEAFEYTTNEVLTTQGTYSYGGYSGNAEFATPLASGAAINAAARSNNYGIFGYDGEIYGYTISASNLFAGEEAYVGLKFDISGATHYGWIRVGVSENTVTVVVKDYAYNIVAGESLEAGEI